MNGTSGGWINLLIVWAVASAVGFVAMAALMVLGDWRVMQALFAAAVIFLALGTLLSILFLNPLPGPQKPGSAGWDMGAHATRTTKPVAAAHGAAAAPAPTASAAPVATQSATAASTGARPAGLNGPRAGGADDLKRIKGIGPKLEQQCHAMGIYHFDQIAGWTADEIAWVNQNLEGFTGRVVRDDWVAQARQLLADR